MYWLQGQLRGLITIGTRIPKVFLNKPKWTRELVPVSVQEVSAFGRVLLHIFNQHFE